MAPSNTMTIPLPGPVMVTCDPPNIATIIPPATDAITPEIGGASEANARPNPKGRAISETTKPEKMFLGKAATKSLFFWRLTIEICCGL
jgi:hypothetical protein